MKILIGKICRAANEIWPRKNLLQLYTPASQNTRAKAAESLLHKGHKEHKTRKMRRESRHGLSRERERPDE
jgi:hypothetical protein